MKPSRGIDPGLVPRGVQGLWIHGYRARVRSKGNRIEQCFNMLASADAFVQRTGLRLHREWWPKA
jgi:hypothetical protein